VVPGGVAVTLRLADELDPGSDHRRPRRLEVVDDEADDRPRPEERVVLVARSVHVDLRPVGRPEPDGIGPVEDRLEPERVAVERDGRPECVGRGCPDTEEAEALDHANGPSCVDHGPSGPRRVSSRSSWPETTISVPTPPPRRSCRPLRSIRGPIPRHAPVAPGPRGSSGASPSSS
jgi:hypothetical protein